jgi:hypothetical protein
MKRSKDNDKAVDTCTQDQPKKHNMTACITATRIIQAKTGNVRTYDQGQTADMTDENKKWILIAEISQTQSPHHYSLVQQVMYHVFVL